MRELLRGRIAVVAVVAAVLCFASACGYHTAGKAAKIPADVKSIAIPAFVNQTQTYRIEAALTDAVIREFHTRTKYQIVSDPSQADATLKGTIISTQFAPLTYDSNSGRATSALVTVDMKVSLTDKSGRVLYENSLFEFREQYQVTSQLSSFFEEQGPAMDRMARDFSRTLVSAVLENF